MIAGASPPSSARSKTHLFFSRGTEFKEDDAVWRGGEDGGVGGGAPGPPQMGGMGPQGGYVAK